MNPQFEVTDQNGLAWVLRTAASCRAPEQQQVTELEALYQLPDRRRSDG